MDLEVFGTRHSSLQSLQSSEIAPACLLRLSVAPQSCGRLLPPAFVLIPHLWPRAVAPRACGSLPPPAFVLILCLGPQAVAPRAYGSLPPPAFVLILCLGPRAVAPRACGSLPPPPGSISLTNSCAKMNQFSNAKYLLA